jgi:hypothetical protein
VQPVKTKVAYVLAVNAQWMKSPRGRLTLTHNVKKKWTNCQVFNRLICAVNVANLLTATLQLDKSHAGALRLKNVIPHH